MVPTFSMIAFAVRNASRTAFTPVSLSYAQQLAAAALGYDSLAAYQASGETQTTFDGPNHYVLDGDRMSLRAHQLGLPQNGAHWLPLVALAIGHCLPGAQFHDSEFAVDEYLHRMVEDAVLRDDDVNSAMSQTNNDGVGEVYLPIQEFHLGELPPPGEGLDLSFGGHVSMDIDTERPYSGHRIPVQVALWLEAKGRVCFAAPHCEVLEARLDYGWGDDD